MMPKISFYLPLLLQTFLCYNNGYQKVDFPLLGKTAIRGLFLVPLTITGVLGVFYYKINWS